MEDLGAESVIAVQGRSPSSVDRRALTKSHAGAACRKGIHWKFHGNLRNRLRDVLRMMRKWVKV
jgi:hypothetical protein